LVLGPEPGISRGESLAYFESFPLRSATGMLKLKARS
jgi:hypothetical protein